MLFFILFILLLLVFNLLPNRGKFYLLLEKKSNIYRIRCLFPPLLRCNYLHKLLYVIKLKKNFKYFPFYNSRPL